MVGRPVKSLGGAEIWHVRPTVAVLWFVIAVPAQQYDPCIPEKGMF